MEILGKESEALIKQDLPGIRLALEEAEAFDDVTWETAVVDGVTVQELVGAVLRSAEGEYAHNIMYNASAIPEIAEFLPGYMIHNAVLTCDNCSMPETESSRVKPRRIPYPDGVIERDLCDGCDTKIREIIAAEQ